MGLKKKAKATGKQKMVKGKPKLSQKDEEDQSLALFESSIPTAQNGHKSKAQRVYDEDQSDVEGNQVSDVSGDDSSDDETVNPMNQLMSALGASVQQDTSSEEESESEVAEGSDEDDDLEDEDEEGLSEDMDDDDDEEEDDVSDKEESDTDGSADGPENEDGVVSGSKKRAFDSQSDEDQDGEVWGFDEDSGSQEELSLAESSYSEEGDNMENGEKGVEKQKEPEKEKKQKTGKKLKPLDMAVDPDDLPDNDAAAVIKKKSAIAETIKSEDPFVTHYELDIEDDQVSRLGVRKQWKSDKVNLSSLGRCVYSRTEPNDKLSLPADTTTLTSLGLRTRLFNLIGKTLKQQCSVEQTGDTEPTLSESQRQLFSIVNMYKDLYNPNVSFDNLEEYRMIYCLHSLNHILKTRLRVTLNSEEKWHSEKQKKPDLDKEYRDQGLTRPKVLILAPFKESARRIINMFESLLMTKKKSFVTNKKRFVEEFSPEDESIIDSRKPDDYIKMFEGNTDDCFRVGLQLSKSGLKLYADFYKADILVCSPLGLRLILGAEGDEKRDYDFMSSIEILIMDQADVFLMQNWDHVLHCLDLLHVQPKESRDTDFSRLRMWTLNGQSKYYRQTIVQSSVHCPELSALFTKHCQNKAGEVRIQPVESPGSICQIVSTMPQLFQRFPSTSAASLPDDRFNYFIKEILPQYRGKEQAGTLLYIPSYYDYVRLRNYLQKERIETSLVCEYTSDKAIRRAKKKFFTKETHFMLYTERVHFFRRMHLRKIRQLIFYSLPTYPQFFSEICNMYKTTQQADASCLVLFSNLDAYKLSMCVGTERTRHMINNNKNVFMFVTGDDER